MKCPYSKRQLRIAASTASHKIVDFETKHGEAEALRLSEEIRAAIEVSDHADLNKKVAAAHKITVEVLINNPNYEILKNEWQAENLEYSIRLMQDAFSLTHEEGWALLLAEELGLTE